MPHFQHEALPGGGQQDLALAGSRSLRHINPITNENAGIGQWSCQAEARRWGMGRASFEKNLKAYYMGKAYRLGPWVLACLL